MLYLLLWITSVLPVTQSSIIIDGYVNTVSAFPGDSIELYLNARSATTYNLKLYDLSGKSVYSISVPVFPQRRSEVNPFESGFGYKVTQRVAVPHLKSGIYLWDKSIPFAIKTRNATISVVYPSNTINAYCNAGGKSLYGFNSSENRGTTKVSFLRPMSLPRHAEAFFKWISKQDFQDIGYIADSDLDEYSSIRKSKLIIIPGHSEYWTLQARKNFDRFVEEGNDALILSGNSMWWQVRYNKSKDQLVCYRDAKADPVRSEKLKTINWCDPGLKYPIYASTGMDFRNGGYGRKKDAGWDGYKIVTMSPLLQGTGLAVGDIIKCPADEMDGVPLLGQEQATFIIDQQTLGFQMVEIVGYDLVSRADKQGVGTWIVFKKNAASGTVINTGSTGWCAGEGIGRNTLIQIITRNMIDKLLNHQRVFSEENIVTPMEGISQ